MKKLEVAPSPAQTPFPSRTSLFHGPPTSSARELFEIASRDHKYLPSSSLSVNFHKHQTSCPPRRRLSALLRRTSPLVPRYAKVSLPAPLKSHGSTDGFAGELVFGVARIFASFNDTFVHVTDLS